MPGSDRYVNVGNSRLPEQKKVMEAIVQDGVCPFCEENLRKYHGEPIIREGDHWLVTPSQWPYKNTQRHYLMITRSHVEAIEHLPPDAFRELGEILQWLTSEHGVAYGGLALRFGDAKKTGASVQHLHAHVVQAADLPEGEKLKFKFSP